MILGIPYTTAIDMWSLGCIAYELFSGYPLFAGENEKQQFMCIMECVGRPPTSMCKASTRKDVFFNQDLTPLSIPNDRGKTKIPGDKPIEVILAKGS